MSDQIQRLRRTRRAAWARDERARWKYAKLGILNSDGTVTVAAPRTNYVWVTMDTGTMTQAYNRGNGAVPLRAGLPVRVREDGGRLIVDGEDTSGLLEGDANAPGSVYTVNDVGPDSHGNISLDLASLSDVNDSAPASGSVLQFSDFDNLWSAVPVDALGLTLEDLNGVDVPSPTNGDVLTYSAGDWVNAATIPTAVAATIHAATLDTGPLDADEVPGLNSAGSFSLIRWTWTTIKAFLKTYFDTLYNLYVHPNHTGDVTSVGDGATTIANDAVTNAKLANMAAATVKGQIVGGSGDAVDLTTAQLIAIIEAGAIYALLAGRSGGQTLNGGTAANDDMVIRGTAHATKASSYVVLADNGGFVIIGAAAGSGTGDTELDVVPNGVAVPLRLRAGTGGSAYIQFTPANASAEWGFLSALSGSMSFSHSTGPLIFQANSAERMRALATAGVVIGGLTSMGASQLGVKAGSSSNDAAVGGTLYFDSTQRGNTTTTLTDLVAASSYNVPADTLSANNMILEFWAGGTFAANNNNKTIFLHFGSESWTVVNTIINNQSWSLRGKIVRTGAATQKIFFEFFYGTTIGNIFYNTASRTLSSANILKLSGQATATNDILLQSFEVVWKDANT